jgi:hypothetical protein
MVFGEFYSMGSKRFIQIVNFSLKLDLSIQYASGFCTIVGAKTDWSGVINWSDIHVILGGCFLLVKGRALRSNGAAQTSNLAGQCKSGFS